MKVNLKRIGAIVAGATILASSVSFAGLAFGSTQLVDGNGAPVAKVVVGEQGAASDGVAAALIASKLASAAYKSSELTAQYTGLPTCSAGNATGGSCTVTNEKATLEITVPGAVAAGTYTVNNLIGDFLNKELLDRNNGQVNYSGSDTSDTANPFTNADGGYIGPSKTEMFRIDGSMFSPFAAVTVSDPSAAKSYSEEQNLYMFGENKYDDNVHNVVGSLDWLAYTLKFKGTSDDLGIPVCTTPKDADYNFCKSLLPGSNVDYATESHKVQVKFLGEDWIISEMVPPTGVNATTENKIWQGGSVKLAKESVSGILNQGESLTVDDIKIQLDDLEAHGESGVSAIISVIDANGNILKKDTIPPATTKEIVVGGKSYRIHVYKIAPGYTFGAKWADMAVYSKELKLVSNQKLDPDYDTNKYYKVYLGWKNKGASAALNQPDHLRTIVVYSETMDKLSSGNDDVMAPGDYIPIVMDPVKWKLSYKGLDLGSDKYDSLDFRLTKSKKEISNDGPYNDLNVPGSCNLTEQYVTVSSGRSGAVFTVQNAKLATSNTSVGSVSDNEFLIAVKGAVCEPSINGGVLAPGTVLMRPSSSVEEGMGFFEPAGGEVAVEYSDIGDGDTGFVNGGSILWQDGTSVGGGTGLIGTQINDLGGGWSSTDIPEWVFAITEKAGTGTSNDKVDRMYFGLDTDSKDFNLDFDPAAGDIIKKDNILYQFAGPVNETTLFEAGEEGYITERGSKFESISSNQVSFSMASDLAHAQWYLASVAASAEAGTTVWTGGEGDQTTVSGVTVKIKEITETATCAGGAGGAPACTPDMTGVSAVIMPNNAATVTAYAPYDFSKYSPLVLLDKDAVGVSTVISVGGDAVNEVTKSILAGTPVDWDAQPKMVKEVVKGSKIVVAGKTAQDTTDAANDFVGQLVAQ